ncbi:MAG: cytochrome P450 [Gammaproteobacteria bacterium]|nr:cytochrome P450 [Gammaproteobacteria bacterium]
MPADADAGNIAVPPHLLMYTRMQARTESPAIDNVLTDPASWADEAGIHERFRWLRTNDPIRRMHPEGFDPYWSITRHHHIKAIEGEKKIFINDPRPILSPIAVQAFVEAVTGRKHLVRSLVQMDDPDHSRYRRLTQAWFLGNNLHSLQPRIDALASAYVDQLASFGGECDFVKDVAVWYPLRVIMTILGVPESDEPLMLKLTQELFGSGDPDTRRSFELDDFVQVAHDFEDYFEALAKEKRKRPTDDVASVIANAKVDGKPLPPLDLSGYYTIIAAAGHDTTSSSIAGGLHALVEHPAEMQKLRNNVDDMMDTAVDEAIRWVTPVRQFSRTATQDYELDGTRIQAGESVALWYPSGNRDEAVFDSPYAFRVDRREKHIAFGFGAHVCLGQHLARMELASMYRELLRRVKHIELAGAPRYIQSIFVGGLKSMPIRYTMQ